jgi:hypothetical protein
MCTIPLAMMRLIMFTAVFCIIFVDRGGWAVALNRVENDFDLSNLQALLPSPCLISLMVLASRPLIFVSSLW